MSNIKSFIIKVFGLESTSEWFHSERVNIFITAIIPGIISFFGLIITYYTNKEKAFSGIADVLRNEVFINSIQLVVIVCTLFVTYRIHHSICVTKEKEPRLLNFIKEKCNLCEQSEEKAEGTLNVVKKIVTQFYYSWIILWCVFLLYYCGCLCFAILKQIGFDNLNNHILEITENTINNALNYLSSSVLFVLFVILNSVTVSITERRTGRSGLISAIFIMIVFGCLIIFPTLFSFSLTGWSYFKLQFAISLFLGIYSALTFVLFLGKLNTNLQIPRVIFYCLYVYALAQIFQFLLISSNELLPLICNCHHEAINIGIGNCETPVIPHRCGCQCSIVTEILSVLDTFKIVFHYITFVGKIFLSLTMLWIVYDSKFIYFVLRQSQANTELSHRMNIFKDYMRGLR